MHGLYKDKNVKSPFMVRSMFTNVNKSLLSTVKVKWGKEMYPGVEVNTDDEPVVFKAQIFALTGVQPERQKVVCKGVTLRDDSWANFKLSNNALVLVMGSKEEDVPSAPVEQTRFVEDMNESELATALDLPEGLINLGNTCYMNATVQCLKTVPELKNALLSYDKSSGGGTAGELTSALSDTMSALEGGGAGACAGAAAKLLRALHATAPRFAERGPGGGLAQQDASECWTEIIRALQARLPSAPNAPANRSSVIEQYFGGTLDVELVCSEAEEPPTRSTETFLQLSCFISQDVKYLQSGLRSKMSEQITKLSQTLGRDAIYTKTEYEDANVESSLSSKNHGDNVGSNNSGYYRLQAVLTHRGRSSSSGHYVAWVARGDSWLRCDDDAVTPVTEEEVLKLSGGGDWHCAYLLLYGPKILQVPEVDDKPEPMITEHDDEDPPIALA
ncbi:hypothetical protein HF086_017763 [Spodoptera exigua]|uniref:Ubiquitin carboxyl-terminal hydrolase n=1 Tax=Spodoptera exigua TaxID=7107 RepID=A0A922MB08_SPOEX|nr:hypothetical protein HF086_017763 [Spodoptera exigua]